MADEIAKTVEFTAKLFLAKYILGIAIDTRARHTCANKKRNVHKNV